MRRLMIGMTAVCFAAGSAHVALANGTAQTAFGGPYVGVQIGHDSVNSETSWTDGIETIEIDGLAGNGLEGGGFAGYGWVNGDTYFGLEAFVSVSEASFSASISSFGSTETEMGFSYGAAARGGYIVNSNTMLYVRASVLTTNFEQSLSTGASGDEDLTGLGIGAGVEVAVWPKGNLRLEYNFVSYESYSQSYLGGTESNEGDNSNVSLGLAFRL
jgi:opacity protein-like surface antigen